MPFLDSLFFFFSFLSLFFLLLLYKSLQCRSELKVAHGEGRLRCNGFIIFRPQFQPSFTGSFVWRNTIRTGVKLASVKYESTAGLFHFWSLEFSHRRRSVWPSWTCKWCVFGCSGSRRNLLRLKLLQLQVFD